MDGNPNLISAWKVVLIMVFGIVGIRKIYYTMNVPV
ncbi:hypothetical protein LINPERHAP1_LOCUS40389 [Linum perenne]